jgi:GntR family transcriptional regulator
MAVPRYQQIADNLRRRIESHAFTADVPLPTEGELQTEYEASRNTVREAVKLLVQQHLLETRAGQGTFITKEIVPFVTKLSTPPETGLGTGGEEGATYPTVARKKKSRETGAGKPEVKVVECPPEIAALLGIDETGDVVSRHQERLVDGTLWSLQTSYYPRDWVSRGAVGLLGTKDIPEGAVEHVAKTTGLKQVGYRDTVSARLPNDEEQKLFNLTHNHTVIEVSRTSFAEDETPIRVTVTVFPSDRNQIVYEIGRLPDLEENQDQGEEQGQGKEQDHGAEQVQP